MINTFGDPSMNKLKQEILENMVELLIIRQLMIEGEWDMIGKYIRYKKLHPDE